MIAITIHRKKKVLRVESEVIITVYSAFSKKILNVIRNGIQ